MTKYWVTDTYHGRDAFEVKCSAEIFTANIDFSAWSSAYKVDTHFNDIGLFTKAHIKVVPWEGGYIGQNFIVFACLKCLEASSKENPARTFCVEKRFLVKVEKTITVRLPRMSLVEIDEDENL